MTKAINLAIILGLCSTAALAEGSAPVPVAPEQSKKIEAPRDVQKESTPQTDVAPESKIEQPATENKAPAK